MMDDIDRTFKRLQRTPLETVRKLIFEAHQDPTNDPGPVWIEECDRTLLRFNPHYERIVIDNGWKLQEFLDEVYK